MPTHRPTRAPAWHLLVFTANKHITGQDQISASAEPLPAWLETLAISRRRPNEADQDVWDVDGQVHVTLAATDGDWLLVRPDGYLSARGTGNTHLRAVLDQLTTAHISR